MNTKTEQSDETNSQDPRNLLAQWANTSNEWVRRIVRQILDSNNEVATEERVLTYQLLLEEMGLKERTLPPEPIITPLGQALGQPEPLHLTHISNVRGVNALVQNAHIDFAPGLTLLFGENGTGKTGYARILKCVAGSRSVVEILPNINQDDYPLPRAEIGYHHGDIRHSHEWTGEEAVFPFTLMSVFDTPSAHLHLDSELGYMYRPASLALFDNVTREVQYIGDAIDSDLKTLKPDTSSLLVRFDSGSSIYPHIESLGASTNLSELQQFSFVPDNAVDRKEAVEISIAGLKAGTIRQQIALQRGFQRVLTEAVGYASIVENLQVQEYNRTLAILSDLRRDQVALRENLFAAAKLPTTPDQTWESFVRSGQSYRRHLEGLGVHDNTRCLYCRQLLGNEAVQLIARYGEYLESQIARDIQEQEGTAKELVKRLQEFSLLAVQDYIVNVDSDTYKAQETPLDRIDTLRSIVDLHADLQKKLTDEVPIVENIPAGIAETRTAIESWLTDLEDTLKELGNQHSDRETRLRELENELIELKDQLELSRSWSFIEQIVVSAQRSRKLQAQKLATSNVLRSITILSTKASAQLTNMNFVQLFSTECAELRTPELELQFFGKEGSAQRRKTLPSNHKPSRVFSEGEQKILAIADFMAETRMSDNSVPVIFDDPVSSLDHRRVQEVASRIADLASDHQVVVFTHDIFFATCLLGLLEKSDRCAYYRVTDEDGKGTVTRGTGPRWDTIKNLTAKVNTTIGEAKGLAGEARVTKIRDAYSWIRSWCEVFVEREVLAQVTERYQPNVRMTQLMKIKLSVLGETIETVTSVFDDACRYIDAHSQPLPTLAIAPSLTQLEEDWKKLKECRSEYDKAH